MKKALFFSLFLSFFALTLPAQEIVTIDSVKYKIKYFLENGEAIIMAQDTVLPDTVIIPQKISHEGVDYPVKKITASAFSNQKKLTSITLPEGIISLGDNSFAGCSNLTTVTLPESVTSLGNRCFYFCTKLSSVNLPEAITTIGEECFYNCPKLVSVKIPEGITSLKAHSFAYCQELISVELPEHLTSLGNSCFLNCSKLEAIELPESVTSLGSACFWGCSSLKNINLPEGLTNLGYECFRGCSGLTSIDIPTSVNNIGSYCFRDCANLFEINCHWTDLSKVKVGSNIFSGIFSEAKIYVPKGTASTYQTTEPWKSLFTSFIETEGSEVQQCAAPSITFNEGKLQFSSETSKARFHYTITAPDAQNEAYSETGIVELDSKYVISVWAAAEGYTNSEITTATLYFIIEDAESAESGKITAIESPIHRGIVVSTSGSEIHISGLENGESVSLYTVGGVLFETATASAGTATLNAAAENIVIVKIGKQSIKVQF